MEFKGQSAIEYLMTYGWMLLVVAIIGGAIFSVVGDQNIESTSGFSGDDVQIADVGATVGDGFEVQLRNNAPDTVEINTVNISEGGKWSKWEGYKDLPVGETEVIALENISEGEGNNELDIIINYDSGNIEGLEASGAISGNYEIKTNGSIAGSAPEPVSNSDFEVTQK